MWNSIPTEDSCSENCPSENFKNPLYLSKEKLYSPTMLKCILPKVLIFTGIFLMVCSMLMIVVRLSTVNKHEDSEGIAAAGIALELIDVANPQPTNKPPQTTDKLETEKGIFTRVKEQTYIPARSKPIRPKVILVFMSAQGGNMLDQNKTCGPISLDFCTFTYNQSRILDADAVIFQGAESNKNKLIQRNNYNPNQIWIYKILQPYMPSWFEDYKIYFNLTANYDYQSDIPYLKYYYSNMGNSSHVERKTSQKEVTVAVYNENCSEEEMFYKKHGKTIQNFSDNNITVHLFRGIYPPEKCNVSHTPHIQPKTDCENVKIQECYDKISPRYKFALAFEIHEVDYISERFFTPLRSGIIPIVIYRNTSSETNYKSLSPENEKSFIPLDENVVQKLQHLNSDETKFNEYFNWRTHGKIHKANWGAWFCQVCGQMFKTQDQNPI